MLNELDDELTVTSGRCPWSRSVASTVVDVGLTFKRSNGPCRASVPLPLSAFTILSVFFIASSNTNSGVTARICWTAATDQEALVFNEKNNCQTDSDLDVDIARLMYITPQ